MDTSYSLVLSWNCSKCVVVFFFRRRLPHGTHFDKIGQIGLKQALGEKC